MKVHFCFEITSLVTTSTLFGYVCFLLEVFCSLEAYRSHPNINVFFVKFACAMKALLNAFISIDFPAYQIYDIMSVTPQPNHHTSVIG